MKNTTFMAATLQGNISQIKQANQVANYIAGTLIVSFIVTTVFCHRRHF